MKVVSMRGVTLDVGLYLAQQENQVALGNAKMNARGDILGQGGTVVKKREDVAAEYHRANPNAAKQVALKDLMTEVFTPAEAVEHATKAKEAPVKRSKKIIEEEE